MLGLLEAQGMASFDHFDESEYLVTLQSSILAGTDGQQEIAGHAIEACCEQETVLPRSLIFCGQRFTPDSWFFQK